MTVVRPLFGNPPHRTALLAFVALALLVATVLPLALLTGPSARTADGSPPLATHLSSRDGPLRDAGIATSKTSPSSQTMR